MTPSPPFFLPLTGLLGGVRRAAQAQHCFEMGPPGRRGCHSARPHHLLAHRSRPIQSELELTAPLVDVVGRSAPTTGSHSPSAEPHQQASPCRRETGNTRTMGPEDELGHDVPLARLVHLQCLHDFRASLLALFSMSNPRSKVPSSFSQVYTNPKQRAGVAHMPSAFWRYTANRSVFSTVLFLPRERK